MSKLSHLLAEKKARFWVRLAIAAQQYLQPTRDMALPERIFYAQVSRIGHKFFMQAAEQELLAKERAMAEEACKHDMAGADAKFCPGCGTTLEADPEVKASVGRIVREILTEYDIKPKAKPKEGGSGGEGGGGKGKKSLAEKMGLGGKK